MTISQALSNGDNNAFAALGRNKVTFAKKPKAATTKAKKEPVVDDWEAAEIAEEEKERATSGGSGDEEGRDELVHTPGGDKVAGTETTSTDRNVEIEPEQEEQHSTPVEGHFGGTTAQKLDENVEQGIETSQ